MSQKPKPVPAASPPPTTGPQRVTLEISDRLPSRLLYKYSMCSKDNLACAARRENKSCWAQEEVAIVVWTPASGNLPAPRFRLNDQSIFRNCDRASLLTYDFNYEERKER